MEKGADFLKRDDIISSEQNDNETDYFGCN
jgi:hypothetical protein